MIQKVFFRIFSWDNSFVNYAIQLTESKAILECRASKESPPLFFTSLIFNRILHAFLSSKIFFRSAGLIEMFAITLEKKKNFKMIIYQKTENLSSIIWTFWFYYLLFFFPFFSYLYCAQLNRTIGFVQQITNKFHGMIYSPHL